MSILKILFLPPSASAFLTACEATDYPRVNFSPPRPATYGYYDTLPETYVGETYRYGGRYYYGGRHEHGSFSDQGLTYHDRYYHNGRYYYGGQTERHGIRRPGGGSGGDYRLPR